MAADQGVRYCGACGAPNPGNAKFCLQCGQPVTAFDHGIQLDATEIKPADAGTSSESSFPFQQAATSQYAKPVGLNRTHVIIAILLSAITLGVYIPYWFLSRRDGLNRLHADRKVPLTPIIILLVLYCLQAVATVAGVLLGIQFSASHFDSLISDGVTLIGLAITLFLSFRIRSMLNQHLGSERVSGGAAFLFGSEQVSGGATFLFTIYYLQYKINRLPSAHNAAPDTASASTKQSYGWLLRLPGDPGGQSTRPSRIIGVGLLGVLVVGGIIAALIQRNGAGSSPSLGSGLGTHICAVAHYDKKQVTCTSDDRTITSLDKAYLSVTGKNGSTFTAANVDVIINKQNSDGTYGQAGSTKLGAGLSYGVVADTLANVFVSASAAPTSGATYQIEVDEGSTNLGTATFTYMSEPATTPSSTKTPTSAATSPSGTSDKDLIDGFALGTAVVFHTCLLDIHIIALPNQYGPTNDQGNDPTQTLSSDCQRAKTATDTGNQALKDKLIAEEPNVKTIYATYPKMISEAIEGRVYDAEYDAETIEQAIKDIESKYGS